MDRLLMPNRKEEIKMTKHAHDGKEDLACQLEHAAESAGRCARKFFDQSAESTNDLTTAIREEPLKAAMIALGVGVVIGAIIRR